MNQRIEPATFNIKQAAQYIGIGEKLFSLYLWTGRIRIPMKRVGSRYIIVKKDVDAWLESTECNVRIASND